MTSGLSAIFRRWRWQAIVPALCMLGGCGNTSLDVGPFTATDQCTGGWQTPCDPPQGSMSIVLDGQAHTFAPSSAVRFQSSVSFEASQPVPLFAIEVWANGPGSYRCEDPSTADRTFVIYGTDTVDGGGTCRIDITQFPTTADPRLEGTFSAVFNGKNYPTTSADPNAPQTVLATGQFSISAVHMDCTGGDCP